jgi:hypothetical protein
VILHESERQKIYVKHSWGKKGWNSNFSQVIELFK